MPDAASSQVSGPSPARADGSAVDTADTRVAGSPETAGNAGSDGPNSESTDAGPTVVAACWIAARVSVRSVHAWVSSLDQLTPVAYPSSSRGAGVTPPTDVALDATATAAG